MDMRPFLGRRRLFRYTSLRFRSGMNSDAKKRLLRLPGQSAMAQSKEKWSNQVRMEGEEACDHQERRVGGTRQSNRRLARPRTKAKMHLLRRSSPARPITRRHRGVSC